MRGDSLCYFIAWSPHSRTVEAMRDVANARGKIRSWTVPCRDCGLRILGAVVGSRILDPADELINVATCFI